MRGRALIEAGPYSYYNMQYDSRNLHVLSCSRIGAAFTPRFTFFRFAHF